MGLSSRCLVLFFGAATSLSLCHAQLLKMKPAPAPQHQAPPGGLAGTWVLKNIALASGQPLLPDMQTELENSRLTIEGENSGKFSFDASVVMHEPGKPDVKCQVTQASPFTVSKLEGHTFMHVAAGTFIRSPKCSPYPVQGPGFSAYVSMFDLAGDTLTTFGFGGGDGVLIFTYVRAKPGFFQMKSPSSR